MNDNGSMWYWVVVFILVILSSFRGAFVDKSVAVRALETQGYSDVRITDQSYFVVGLRGCDGSDAARFTATAKNPAGKDISIYVCSGWIFKGATIRTR